MKLYNTLTRKIEAFAPLSLQTISLYVCGPTVYDDPHIGHARSAYVFDVLRRTLRYHFREQAVKVRFVRNVTDVDDKIIDRARQESGAKDLCEACRIVSSRYLERYHALMHRLGIEPPDEEPKATDHVVPEMTDLIAKLLIQGVAYEAGGDVYFAVRKFAEYGKLSNRSLDELQAGNRVEPGENKQDPMDFALWKAAKPGEPSWPSPWGPGRPGWHIECSAMSTKYLGDTFDIHGGGVDLVFPHHENEVAQAQAAGKPFARFWVHNGLLTVSAQKMSKSLGNYITLEDALRECRGEANILKVFFLGAHYRSPIDYSPTSLQSAMQRFDAYDSFLTRVEASGFKMGAPLTPVVEEVATFRAEFEQAMEDDLNTPKALAVLDRMVSQGNQWIVEHESFDKKPSAEQDAQAVYAMLPIRIGQLAQALETLGGLLGLSFSGMVLSPEDTQVQVLLKEREEARKRKDFKRADEIRQLFESRGLVIEDTPKGPLVRRKR